ncbi:20180_t:CDS:1, partial [Gigaspora margarita]
EQTSLDNFLSYKGTITDESSNPEESNNNNISSLEELYNDDSYYNDEICENDKSSTKVSLSSTATVFSRIPAKRKN